LKPWVLAAQDSFADGPLVGVNHDADWLTIFRRAGWLYAGGGWRWLRRGAWRAHQHFEKGFAVCPIFGQHQVGMEFTEAAS
jgi:hypothetical protein